MYVQFRTTVLFQKNLDDPMDDGAMIGIPYSGRALDFDALGGSFYYSIAENLFGYSSIFDVGSNNAVLLEPGSFKDIKFMHHSLQPGEYNTYQKAF